LGLCSRQAGNARRRDRREGKGNQRAEGDAARQRERLAYAAAQLHQREEERRGDRKFSADELANNEKEKAKPRQVKLRDLPEKAKPNEKEKREIEANRNTLAVLDPAGRPVMEPAVDLSGKPLDSRSEYEKNLTEAQKENAGLLADLEKETKTAIALTEELIDQKTPFRKGLRTQLSEEREKGEGIVEEQRLVRPLLVNTEVESGLLDKRLDGLQRRIEELKRYMKKRKIDVVLSKR